MSILDFFRRQGSAASAKTQQVAHSSRRSSGLFEFHRSIKGQEGLTVLDLGPTSPANIGHLTGLGHKLYNEDVLLASFRPEYQVTDAETGQPAINVKKFLIENLNYAGGQFDAVVCWDVCDYLPESLVKSMVERLYSITKPGSIVLAFFHTRDAGAEAPYFRYNIRSAETLEMVQGPQFRLQRVFNNRHIENLFKDFSNIKFFLARDNVREVLIVR